MKNFSITVWNTLVHISSDQTITITFRIQTPSYSSIQCSRVSWKDGTADLQCRNFI